MYPSKRKLERKRWKKLINLEDIQKQLFHQFGQKIDVYHSEMHRAIIAVLHNKPLHPMNIIFHMSY